MKKGFKIFAIILLFVVVSVAVIFTYNKIQDNKLRNLKYSREYSDISKERAIEAENKAIAYIQDKYGFTPEITGFAAEYEAPYEIITGLIGRASTSQVFVKANYNGRDFMINVDTKYSVDSTDTYQEKEIEKALKDYFAQYYTVEPEAYDIEYWSIEHKYNPNIYGNFTNYYFDENNIEEFLKNEYPIVRYYYVNVDNIEEMYTGENNSFNLYYINCRNKSDIKQLRNRLKNEYRFYREDTGENAIYFSQIYCNSSGKSTLTDYNLEEYDEIKYYRYNQEDDVTINAYKIPYDHLEDMYDYNSYDEYTPISYSYAIETDNKAKDKVVLYIPKKELTKSNDNFLLVKTYDLHSYSDYIENTQEDYIFCVAYPYQTEYGSVRFTVYDVIKN